MIFNHLPLSQDPLSLAESCEWGALEAEADRLYYGTKPLPEEIAHLAPLGHEEFCEAYLKWAA